MEKKLNVLIVDDTTTYRSILKRVVDKISISEVISTAKDGLEALEEAKKHQPDVILLDVEMPRMDGLETLGVLRTLFPNLPVIMVSGASRFNAQITLKCLEAGAIDFVTKPDHEDIGNNIDSLIKSITPLFQHILENSKKFLKKSSQSKPILPLVSSKHKPSQQKFNFEAISIGISTGGPKALMQLIPKLPELGLPIFLTIHMPPTFTASLADRLNQESQLTVVEGSDGQEVQPNVVYVAPGGKHMITNRRRGKVYIKITETPPVKSCRPSVDVTLESLVQVYRGNILSLIMTGMGNDGESGVKAMKALGGYSLTQSEDSCVVYGMPKAVDLQGLSDERIHLDRMAEKVVSLIKNSKKRLSA